MAELFFKLLLAFLFFGKTCFSKRIYVQNKRKFCIDSLNCDGSLEKPFGTFIGAFSAIAYGDDEDCDNFLEILLEPNTMDNPYIIFESDIRDSTFFSNPSSFLKGKK